MFPILCVSVDRLANVDSFNNAICQWTLFSSHAMPEVVVWHLTDMKRPLEHKTMKCHRYLDYF